MRITPAFNLKLNLSHLDIRFSYAHGFRIPSLKEMYFNFVDINHDIHGNPDLKSEYSRNLHLHFDSKFSNMYQLKMNLFYNRINDFITLIQNDNTIMFDYFLTF